MFIHLTHTHTHTHKHTHTYTHTHIYIDLTIIHNQLLSAVYEWEIREQDSCSDHNILRYVVGHSKTTRA